MLLPKHLIKRPVPKILEYKQFSTISLFPILIPMLPFTNYTTPYTSPYASTYSTP